MREINLDELFEKATSAGTEKEWFEVAKMFLEDKVTVGDLVAYVDETEPAEQEDWTLRAELFEYAMYIMSMVREYEKLKRSEEKN